MWIVTNKGFLSVMAKDRDGKASSSGPEGVVSVRFRRKRDAAALFPGHAVVATPGGDYGFRVFATRAGVAEVLAREVLGIDYVNFKSSIPAGDAPLHDVAMSAWTVFGRLQAGGPYGRNCRSRTEPADKRPARKAAA